MGEQVKASDLLKINVNEHTESKNGLTYLSWAWAWAKVLELDPAATWDVHEYEIAGQAVPFMLIHGTAMVKVTVVINGRGRSCVLPVMDHRNKAIQTPDAFQVNTAIMRCLAKAIAMHGLGLYIYAGEDLPPIDTELLDEFTALLVQLHDENNTAEAVRQWYGNESIRTSNEAREYAWVQLRDHSAIRSAIKANKPEERKAA